MRLPRPSAKKRRRKNVALKRARQAARKEKGASPKGTLIRISITTDAPSFSAADDASISGRIVNTESTFDEIETSSQEGGENKEHGDDE